MPRENIYKRFHKKSKVPKKIITESNFTYFYIIQIINKYLRKEKNLLKVLDVGCGVGSLSLYLVKRGLKVDGIDISKKAIQLCKEYAKQKNLDENVRFLVSGFYNLKTKDCYDLIICSEVLEHLENDSKALLKLKTLLTKDGILIITTPSLNAPLFKLGLAKQFDKRVGHLRRYSTSLLSDLAKKSGLEIIEMKKVEGIIRNSLYLFGKLNFLIRFIKGPLVGVINFFDNLSKKFFGESQIIVILKNK